MFSKLFFFASILAIHTLAAVDFEKLNNAFREGYQPFSYPLAVKLFQGNQCDESVIICCHGYGSNNSIGDVIYSYQATEAHLISFNFPDHDIVSGKKRKRKIAYGSIDELLPALWVMKRAVVDAGANKISLYGFSAGGGAVVNIIAVLNSSKYDAELRKVGISSYDKEKMVAALQRGWVLLDAPLKSSDEILETKGYDKELANRARIYRQNDMRPIDALERWRGLNLSVVLFFQNPDTSLTNRDDDLFIRRLKEANNKGVNKILVQDQGGHLGFHRSLWEAIQ